jgi:hypothetical protein
MYGYVIFELGVGAGKKDIHRGQFAHFDGIFLAHNAAAGKGVFFENHLQLFALKNLEAQVFLLAQQHGYLIREVFPKFIALLFSCSGSQGEHGKTKFTLFAAEIQELPA